MESTFFGVIFLAIVVEGIISYITLFFVDGKIKWQVIIAIILGMGVAVAYGVDLFALAGLQSRVPYIGSLLTGILLSRGSNYIFDLMKLVSQTISRLKEPS